MRCEDGGYIMGIQWLEHSMAVDPRILLLDCNLKPRSCEKRRGINFIRKSSISGAIPELIVWVDEPGVGIYSLVILTK